MPLPPLYGDKASGYLVDLSAGGMALVISDLIPKNVFLRMRMSLPDGFIVESVVKVRRIVKQGPLHDYLHGIEFMNPSPEMIERIELMAKDVLACNERTQQLSKEICVSGCSLGHLCKRPQRVEVNIRPVLSEITKEAAPAVDWALFNAKFDEILSRAPN